MGNGSSKDQIETIIFTQRKCSYMAETAEMPIAMDEIADITRYTRIPESLDLKLLEYCRTHHLMKITVNHTATGEPVRSEVPNLSEGIRKILESVLR